MSGPDPWDTQPIVGTADKPADRRIRGQQADIEHTDATTNKTVVDTSGAKAELPFKGPAAAAGVRKTTGEAVRVERENVLPNLTPGQQAADEAWGKDYAAWVAGGGAQGLRNKLQQVAKLQQELRAAGTPGTLSGPLVGRSPKLVRQVVNERSLTMENDARALVTATLRQILGAQFTEKEGERIFNQSFDPTLSEEANAHNLQRILKENLTNAAGRIAATSFYEKNGTLQGFTQDRIADEFNRLTAETQFAASGDRLAPEQEQKLRAYIDSPDFTPEGYVALHKQLAAESGREPDKAFEDQALKLGQEIAERKARGESFGPGLRYVSPEATALPGQEDAAPPQSGLDRTLDVAAGATTNLIPDLGRVVYDTAKGMWDLSGKSELGPVAGRWFPMASLPRAMAKEIGNLGSSALAKLGVGNASPQLAEAVGKMYADRYGSTDAALNTLRDHPAEMLMDIATVFTGGEAAAPRLAAQIGKVSRLADVASGVAKAGELSGVAARATDPFIMAQRGTGAAAGLASKYIPQGMKDALTTLAVKYPAEMIGLPSGIGGENVRTGFSVGRERTLEGPTPRTEAYTGHLRDQRPVEEIVAEMEAGVQRIRDAASERYATDMAGVRADQTILNFDNIDAALANLKSRAYYKDQVRDPAAARAYGDVQSIVEEWKSHPPADFHTPEGMDALKQRIGGLEQKYQTENDRAAASIVGGVRKTVAEEITQQAPSYAEAMKNYSEAKDLLGNIRLTLDSGKGRTDSTIRRLQGILRRDDPGYAGKLIEQVDAGPGTHLREMIAGRAGEPIRPERYRAAVAGGMGLASLPLEMLLSGNMANLALDPKYLAMMTMMSPRVVSTGAYGAGRAAGLAELAAKGGYGTYQASPAGRLGVNALSTGERAEDALAQQNAVPSPSLADLAQRYPDTPVNPRPDEIVTPNYGRPAQSTPDSTAIPPGSRYDPATHSWVLPDGTRIPAPDMVSPVTAQ